MAVGTENRSPTTRPTSGLRVADVDAVLHELDRLTADQLVALLWRDHPEELDAPA